MEKTSPKPEVPFEPEILTRLKVIANANGHDLNDLANALMDEAIERVESGKSKLPNKEVSE